MKLKTTFASKTEILAFTHYVYIQAQFRIIPATLMIGKVFVFMIPGRTNSKTILVSRISEMEYLHDAKVLHVSITFLQTTPLPPMAGAVYCFMTHRRILYRITLFQIMMLG